LVGGQAKRFDRLGGVLGHTVTVGISHSNLKVAILSPSILVGHVFFLSSSKEKGLEWGVATAGQAVATQEK
jgi:hypothetical protein